MNQNNEIGLYLLNRVRLLLDDGTEVIGQLNGIGDEDGVFEIDDDRYASERIRDVSYIGRVTDYHTYVNYGEIDGKNGKRGIRFEETDILSEEDRQIITGGAFVCDVTAHLYMKDGKLAARNVQVYAREHIIPPSVPGTGRYLFRFTDGSARAGSVIGIDEKLFLRTEHGQEEIRPENVEDITRAPEVNESVEAELNDGTLLKGTVLVVTGDAMNLQGRYVPFSGLRKLFYFGVISSTDPHTQKTGRNRWVLLDQMEAGEPEAFLCKRILFRPREDYDRLIPGMRIRFAVAVCHDDLVAADAEILSDTDLREDEELCTESGLIVYYPDKNKPGSYGLVADEYLSREYCRLTGKSRPEKGNAFFTSFQMNFVQNKTDLTVVSSECARQKDRPEETRRVIRMTVTETLDRETTAYAGLDEEGKLHTQSFGVLYLPRMLQNHARLIMKDGNHIDGWLSACDDKTVTVNLAGKAHTIPLNEISDVRYYGTVMIWDEKKRNGYVGVKTENGKEEFYFDVSHISNIEYLSQRKEIRPGTGLSFLIGDAAVEDNYCQAIRMRLESIVYIVKYIPDKNNVDSGYGFMVREEELEEALRTKNRSGSIYFRKNDIEDDGGFQLNTYSRNYYRATSVIRGNKPGQGIAQHIHILEALEFPKSAKNTVGVSGPAQPQKTGKQRSSLGDYGALPVGDGYRIGFIGYSSAATGIINDSFFNGHYYPGFYDNNKTVCYDPARTTLQPDVTLRTNKYAYLVRYVPSEEKNDLGQQLLDYSHPIEVLQQFPKKEYARMDILDQQTLEMEYVTAGSMQKQTASPSKVSGNILYTDIPDYHRGESMIVDEGHSAAVLRVFEHEENGEFLFEDGARLSASRMQQSWRFGLVTEFSQANGTARLNGGMEFSIGIMEDKLINILKNQNPFSGVHVVYRHDEDRVTDVTLIPEDWMGLVQWEAGSVSSCDKAARKIKIDLDSGETVIHVISVKSEPLVSRKFRSDTLTSENVYARRVLFPQMTDADVSSSDETVEWGTTQAAIDVRCMYENAKICYDRGKNMFYAERNQTETFALTGERSLLESNRGREAEITFEVSGDGRFLQARLSDDEWGIASGAFDADPEELEADETQTESMAEESLARLLMEQTYLRGIHPDATDRAESIGHAQKMFDGRAKKMKKTANDYLVMAKLAILFPEVSIKSAVKKPHAFDEDDAQGRQKRIGRWLLRTIIREQWNISKNADLSMTEFSCYLTTLLRYDSQKYREQWLYRLFLIDFESREKALPDLAVDTKGESYSEKLSGLFEMKIRDVDEFLGRLVMTDETSFAQTLKLIHEGEKTEQSAMGRNSMAIRERAEQIDEIFRAPDADEAARLLRNWYETNKRRFAANIRSLAGESVISGGLREVLTDMRVIFEKLICAKERERFEALYEVCTTLQDYTQLGGFSGQERALTEAWRSLDDLETDILEHPGRETLELLIYNAPFQGHENVLSLMKREAETLLNRLYEERDTLPQIMITPNTPIIRQGQTEVWLIVANGGNNPRPASDVRLYPESYTEGIIVPRELPLPGTLSSESPAYVKMDIILETADPGVIRIGCAVEYRMATRYRAGEREQETIRQESGTETQIELQIGSDQEMIKQVEGVKNPYEGPAKGNPITDDTMFFGREEEKKEIWNNITTREDGQEMLKPGATVIIWGQKKCGKTSLVNQIKNRLRDSELFDQSIIISIDNILSDVGGAEALDHFQTNLYGILLNRFEDEIYDNHPDVVRLVEEGQLVIPDFHSERAGEMATPMFDRFMREFRRADQGRHTIVLFLDEFTILAMSILERIAETGNESLQSVLGFIKSFSQYGIVQVIIGHEAMMRALDRLNVINHTAEFAKTVEIAALDEDASRKLIQEPMQHAFGFDVYETPLGAQAIDRLLYLSGRHPTYLMRICSQMFMYYTDMEKCPGNQILKSDVDAMCREYTSELQLNDFESMLVEDGDKLGDAEQRDTYKYLRCAAQLSFHAGDGMADGAQLRTILMNEDKMTAEAIESTRQILENRRVIAVRQGNRVRINTGLFTEYYVSRYGKR